MDEQVGLEPETEGSVVSERQEQTAGELCERSRTSIARTIPPSSLKTYL